MTMKRLNHTVAAICSLAVAMGTFVGCSSTNNSKPAGTGKLMIMSDRGCIPPPFEKPQQNNVQVKPAAPSELNTSTGQPPLAAPEDATFVPGGNEPIAPVVFTPGESAKTSPKTPAPTAEKSKAERRVYVVKSGDFLSSIAYQYKISWKELAKENNLTEKSVLKVGQKLYLPANAAATPRPKQQVKKAAKTTAAKASAAANSQKITAKAATQSAAKGEPIPADGFYTIKSGDNLWLVAKRFQVKSSKIRDLNPNVNFDKLQIGTRIRLRDVNAPATVAESAAPKADEGQPAPLNQDTPAAEVAVPVPPAPPQVPAQYEDGVPAAVETPAPAAETPAPVVETPAPAAETPAPAAETPAATPALPTIPQAIPEPVVPVTPPMQ